MDWLLAGWQISNAVMPAIFLALMVPSVTALLWRGRLRQRRRWWQAVAWCLLANVSLTVLGWALSGHDGAMLTYLSMLAACATVLSFLLRRSV